MKYLFLISTLFILSCTGSSDDTMKGSDVVNNPLSADGATDSKFPVMTFEKQIHDFGKIVQGEKLTYNFKFKNTGNADLLITSATASCGCTVADYPKTPIHSGEGSSIAVEFNSEGRKGMQTKNVTVLSNAQPATTTLTINAMIIEP